MTKNNETTKVLKQSFETLIYSEIRVNELAKALKKVKKKLKRLEEKLPELEKRWKEYEQFKKEREISN